MSLTTELAERSFIYSPDSPALIALVLVIYIALVLLEMASSHRPVLDRSHMAAKRFSFVCLAQARVAGVRTKATLALLLQWSSARLLVKAWRRTDASVDPGR
jgi:hypothetical protein